MLPAVTMFAVSVEDNKYAVIITHELNGDPAQICLSHVVPAPARPSRFDRLRTYFKGKK